MTTKPKTIPLNFDDSETLVPLTPEVEAVLTERQRKAFARYATARRAPLSPEQIEIMASLDEVSAADKEALAG